MSGVVRIGISGWRYAGWRGVFYPKDLVQRRELEFASHTFPTIEINGSFYSLQRPEDYASWYEQTPSGFVFSVKAGRYITHLRRLREIRSPLANFFASGLLALREKLGPVLWQFPPNMRYDAVRFEGFLELLPHDTAAAARLASGHSEWMAGRTALDVDQVRPLRHAIEIRHDSFRDASFIELLRKHGVALVVADSPGKWPYLEDVTADFVYVRLHGEKELYASGYTDDALDRWARRIEAWRAGKEPADAQRASDRSAPARAARDVYCYFDNDAKVRAPFDAKKLMEKLGLAAPPAAAQRRVAA
ncbi:MAG TPA: DUF72 domain-containing protein [Burkholderiales bacterium]|nr:DUF72 domain-containing protein [Burkholderiales bacterium]